MSIVERTLVVLREVYGETAAQDISSAPCGACGYPAPLDDLDPATSRCPACQALALG
jgi:predicted Zn-ribbon and HTH transcriptional regulator